ncbi:MAG TPA: hypothetical protein VFA12_05425 [Stellaceae bacterium]|nr:hypothetical protein [Stellaceae bacterium]
MPLPPIQPIGVGTAVAHPRQAWQATLSNWLVAPGATNPPVIFEPPPGLTNGVNEAWIAASGGANWGGCQVWVSLDGSTYGLAGTIYRGCVTGVATAPFPAHPSPDTGDTLSLDLTQSGGQLLSGTLADAENLLTLCWLDGELIAYETATLTAPYRYDLGTTIIRGAYGTPITGHAAGAAFARLNGSVFKYPFPSNLVPQTFYVKLPAFNIFGQALQDIAGVAAYTYTTTGAGTNPLANPLLAALAAGGAQDWGIAGTTTIAAADLAPVSIAASLDIVLGTLS